MVVTPQEYRDFANYCIDLAERASPSGAKKLHRMAEVWLDLAAFAENAPQQAAAPYEYFKKLH
jgi:hypothetical protein